MPREGLSSEQFVAKLRQIEVLTSQGKTIGQACRDASISEQSYATSVWTWRSFTA
jgi:hypothetical protein